MDVIEYNIILIFLNTTCEHPYPVDLYITSSVTYDTTI